MHVFNIYKFIQQMYDKYNNIWYNCFVKGVEYMKKDKEMYNKSNTI